MGVNYEHGYGCEQSDERAAEWYNKAVAQGHAPAMAALGGFYHNGKGVPQNRKRAARRGDVEQPRRCAAAERARTGGAKIALWRG